MADTDDDVLDPGTDATFATRFEQGAHLQRVVSESRHFSFANIVTPGQTDYDVGDLVGEWTAVDQGEGPMEFDPGLYAIDGALYASPGTTDPIPACHLLVTAVDPALNGLDAIHDGDALLPAAFGIVLSTAVFIRSDEFENDDLAALFGASAAAGQYRPATQRTNLFPTLDGERVNLWTAIVAAEAFGHGGGEPAVPAVLACGLDAHLLAASSAMRQPAGS